MNEEPLEQSLALNKIVLQLLEDMKNEAKRLWAALVISILLNMVIILGVFCHRPVNSPVVFGYVNTL